MLHRRTVTKSLLFLAVMTFWPLSSNAQFFSMGAWTRTSVSGFGGNGTRWQVNNNSIGSVPVTGDILTLTDGGGGEARCAYRSQTVTFQNGFSASYTYTASGGADGTAFVIQNSGAGTSALGGAGGGLGYYTTGSSFALEFNLYGGASGGPGYEFATNGGYGVYSSTSPVSLVSGDPIRVTVNYNIKTMLYSFTLQDLTTSQQFSTTVSSVDLVSLLGGSKGYVGFCGGTGGVTSTQTISNFQFSAF